MRRPASIRFTLSDTISKRHQRFGAFAASTVHRTAAHGSSTVRRRRSAAGGFSLVELLTVVFIISLLIALLVPALSSARTAAKKAVGQQTLNAIKVGMEAFRNDNGSTFVQTNGYPPSFVHPPIWDGSSSLNAVALNNGAFPFLPGYPVAYGAHWLPAMLMGVDNRGYIKSSAVPNTQSLPAKPEEWYTPDPLGNGKLIPRVDPYCDSGNLRTLLTKDLPGQVRSPALWTDQGQWQTATARSIGRLPVVVDGFDYPVLYYVANKNGQPTNMVAAGTGAASTGHDPNNAYPNAGDAQKSGVPFYFHYDNAGFTGVDDDDDPTNGVAQPGWEFSGPHPAGAAGGELDAQALMQNLAHSKKVTFARYVLDRKLHRDLSNQDPASINKATPLRPVNADSYILWSPGADGKWGTVDDISNMPPFTE